MGTPAISVVMAVFNGEQYLVPALDSILRQSFPDFEFIIVDDGSTDASPRILSEYARRDSRLRILSQQNQGLTKSLHQAVSLASGEFVARMDADDESHPDRFMHQTEYLRSHSDHVVVGSALEMMTAVGEPLYVNPVPLEHDEIVRRLVSHDGIAIAHPTAMIRRDVLMSVGQYDVSYACAQDLDLWLRLSEVGRLANLAEPLLRYRIHAKSVTSRRRLLQLECAQRAVRAALERQGISQPAGKRCRFELSDDTAQQCRYWSKLSMRKAYVRSAWQYATAAWRASPADPRNLALAGKLLWYRLRISLGKR